MAEAVLTAGATTVMANPIQDKKIAYTLLHTIRTGSKEENCLSFMLKNPEFVKAWEGILQLCVFEYTNKVKEIMRNEGATEKFINDIVTVEDIKYAIANDISADDFAWGLMF